MSLPKLLTRSANADDARWTDSGATQYLSDREGDLWLVVIAAMALDVALTVFGLSVGLQEMNPIARHALDTAGVFGLAGLKLGALLVGVCCLWLVPDPYRSVVPIGLAVPSVVAVGVNAALIAVVLL
jgi:hypothetical protein